MAVKKKSGGKQVEPCPKCGNTDPWGGSDGTMCTGRINKVECHHCGKHIGECFECGFTLVSDRNDKCPRCHGKIHNCQSCGASIKAGEKKCSACK